jgi:hypothetical protein
VCKQLGLSYPSWINRGAKLMNAIGMGSGSGAQGAVDHEGRPLRDADRQTLVMEQVVDVCLDSLLDLKKLGMLGGRSSVPLASIIPVDSSGARTKLPVDKQVQSDSDEQLLLFLPFTRPVKLLSFLVRLSARDEQSNPRTVKLFANRPNMDFGDAESTTPTHVVTMPANPGREYTKEEKKEGLFEHVVTLPPVKFHGLTFLTIFIADNHGASTTKLAGLTLVGRDK